MFFGGASSEVLTAVLCSENQGCENFVLVVSQADHSMCSWFNIENL